MSDVSAVLSLPYIQPSQAQKHVTHNEGLRVLDTITQLAVVARDLDTPPAAPETGARYIVGAGGSGDWAGQADAIATREDSMWVFTPPQAGWLAYVIDEAVIVAFDAVTGWDALTGGGDMNADTLGINTSADLVNRLAVASDATLFTHDGTDHQMKVNKASDADTASLLFQSNWVGHAEMGLAGNTDFSIKVSADGSTFNEAMRIDGATAIPGFPQGAEIDGLVTGDAVQADIHDGTDGRLLTVGAFGLGQDGSSAGITLDSATTSGFYNFSNSDPSSPGGTGGVVIVTRYSVRWANQVVFAPNETFMWLRWTKDDGVTWSDWSPIYTTANVVGAVAELGGTPTGAIIERGSNSNGDYVRYADGTQICTLVETVAVATLPSGALHRDAAVTDWTYPAAFAAKPAVSVACEAVGLWADAGSVSATACGRVVWAPLSTTSNEVVHAQATGRWF